LITAQVVRAYYSLGDTMLPFPIKPMQLQPVAEPFDSPNHIFEWKVDGIRCIMFYDDGKVRLQSRTGKDCTRQFTELWAPPVVSNKAVLDGEVTVLTEGKPDFEAVMERYLASNKKLTLLVNTKPAFYVVWDILWLDGRQLTGLPLLERKIQLAKTVEDSDNIQKILWVDNEGLALWDAIRGQGLEGIVAKRKNSRYVFGQRSAAWVKVKNYQEVEVNVLGYKKKDGAVLVGPEDRVKGHAIGIRLVDKVVLRELLNQYGDDKGGTIWLPPGIRGRVQFTTLTTRGNMRDCSWIRFKN